VVFGVPIGRNERNRALPVGDGRFGRGSRKLFALAALTLAIAGNPAGAPTASAQSSTAGPAEAVPRFGDPRGKPEKPSEPVRTIRFLTGSAFPPFNFVDSTGQLNGFNIELARAICRQLKAVCTIQAEPFDKLVEALHENKGDAIIAGLSQSGNNAPDLAFTIAYLRLPGRFAVRKDAGIRADPAGLSGRTVSVIAQTAHEAYLKAYFPKIRIVAEKTAEAAREALKQGKVDAYFGDAMSLSFWLIGTGSDKCCQFSGGPHLERFYFGDGLAIATARNNTVLLANLNYALSEIVGSPQFADLYERFFPLGFY